MYDAIERVAAVITANFDADFDDVLAAHALTEAAVISKTAAVHPRREWVVFSENPAFGPATPGVGVYPLRFSTNARRQDERLWRVTVGLDYYARGPDPAKLALQAELAAEVLLRSIDRCHEGLAGTRVLDAGMEDGSVTGERSRTADLPAGDDWYEELLRIAFPVIYQEVGLG